MKSIIRFALVAIIMTASAFTLVSCEKTLDEACKEANKSCPQKIDEGIEMTKIALEGDYVVYECTVDGNIISIDALTENQAKVKESMVNSLKQSYQSNKEVKGFLDLAFLAKKNIKYTFKDTAAGKSLDIIIDNDTLNF